MRKIGQRGLTLVGFKPRSKAIKAWYHVRNAQFIYPDEKTTQGKKKLTEITVFGSYLILRHLHF